MKYYNERQLLLPFLRHILLLSLLRLLLFLFLLLLLQLLHLLLFLLLLLIFPLLHFLLSTLLIFILFFHRLYTPFFLNFSYMYFLIFFIFQSFFRLDFCSIILNDNLYSSLHPSTSSFFFSFIWTTSPSSSTFSSMYHLFLSLLHLSPLLLLLPPLLLLFFVHINSTASSFISTSSRLPSSSSI